MKPKNYLEMSKAIDRDIKLEKARERVIKAAKRWATSEVPDAHLLRLDQAVYDLIKLEKEK